MRIILSQYLLSYIMEKKPISVTAEKLTVELTQEETLAFNISDNVEIQIRALTGTNAIASNVINTKAQKILKEGVI